MTYSKTTWADYASPALSAANLNKIEQGIADAHNVMRSSAVAGGNARTQLQADMDTAASAKRPLYVDPGVYDIDIAQLSIPSNLTMLAYGATFRTAHSGLFEPCILVDRVDNVKIFGLTVDGQKANWGSTEFKHGLMITGATRVHVQDVTFQNCKGDGFYVGSYDATQVHAQDVTGINILTSSNARQNMSIVDLRRGNFTNVRAVSGAFTGLDIEPDYNWQVVEDVDFYRCDFSSNGAYGIGLTSVDSALPYNAGAGTRNINFYSPRAVSNTLANCLCHNLEGASFYNPYFASGSSYGMYVRQRFRDLKVYGGKIISNTKIGVWVECFSGAVPQGIERLLFNGVGIHGNGTSGTYGDQTGIHLYKDGVNSDNYIRGVTVHACDIGNLSGTTQQRGVVSDTGTTTGVSRVRLTDNDLNGNTDVGTALTDDIATRVDRGNVGVTSTTGVLKASTTYDPASQVTGNSWTTTVTVTGAAVGDIAVASHSSITTGNWDVRAYVSAANTVTVYGRNDTGGTVDLASGTLRVAVIKLGGII